jgi:hypothetical protein
MKRKRLTDRRKYVAAPDFPLTDRAGCIIPFNRSRKPDRRLHNYLLEEIDNEEFHLAVIHH